MAELMLTLESLVEGEWRFVCETSLPNWAMYKAITNQCGRLPIRLVDGAGTIVREFHPTKEQ